MFTKFREFLAKLRDWIGERRRPQLKLITSEAPEEREPDALIDNHLWAIAWKNLNPKKSIETSVPSESGLRSEPRIRNESDSLSEPEGPNESGRMSEPKTGNESAIRSEPNSRNESVRMSEPRSQNELGKESEPRLKNESWNESEPRSANKSESLSEPHEPNESELLSEPGITNESGNESEPNGPNESRGQSEPHEPNVSMNRQQRRYMAKMERLRRKKDIFVVPQGPKPSPIPRGTQPRKPSQQKLQQESTVTDDIPIGEPTSCGDEAVAWSEVWGEFNFRDTILDQLERYWVYLDRMRRRDQDAYQFYRQVGVTIVPLAAIGMYHGLIFNKEKDKEKDPIWDKPATLSPWFNQHRPGFGCYAYGIASKIEDQEINPPDWYKKEKKGLWLWIPKFMYFVKYKQPPPELQPMSGGGDVYKMVIWWDQPKRNRIARLKGGAPTEYGVWVSRDGKEIQVLRMIETRMVPILYKYKKPKHSRYFSIPERAWHMPDEFENWAKANGTDVQHFLSHLFADAAKTFEYSNYSMVRVNVHKDNMTAVFGVNIHRMSYFFKDRDYVLRPNGQRKPIFHIVRSHERIKLNGGTTAVKMHFRGDKEFTWAGYDVQITIPGKDHGVLAEIAIGSDDTYWYTPEEIDDSLTQEQFGKVIAEYVATGNYDALKEHKRGKKQRDRKSQETDNAPSPDPC
jgi:hypothetical protein